MDKRLDSSHAGEPVAGRWCSPRNDAAVRDGSVHVDAVARRHGYATATVATAVHLEQFVPLLLEWFGDAWWRRGGISLRCVAASVVGEPVRCYLQDTGAGRARVWMNTEGEALVLEGSAALGEDPHSELELIRSGTQAGAAQGHTGVPHPVVIDGAAVDARLPLVTEPLACYRDAAQFGGRVVPPSLVVHALQGPEDGLVGEPRDRFGVGAGLELRYLNGPVLCGRDYQVRGRILDLARGRETGTVCYQAELLDAGRTVVRLVRMERREAPLSG